MITPCTCHNKTPQGRATVTSVINRVMRADPTRTLTLRDAFAREMRKRFNALKRDIRISIVDRDGFGLREPERAVRALTPADPKQFAFTRTGDKVRSFMTWLEQQERLGILEITRGARHIGAGEGAWTDIYIQSAYQRGIARGRSELRKAGYDIPQFEGVGEQQQVAMAFNQPFHADRVGLLYTRTFNDLKGVTQAMNTQISRVLAQGMAEGKNPRTVARELNKQVDRIGRRRAEMVARTEMIRAHHVASINEYRAARAEGVLVRAEWSTAGTGVCPDCAGLEGTKFSLNKIEGMIPLHPLCRCVAIPVQVGVKKGRA